MATTEINIDYYEELERLATIGKATEKALKNKKFYIKERGMPKTGVLIETTSELLEWAESED